MRRLASLPLVLLALAPARAWAEPRPHTHVACVGDSITAGSGATPGKEYPLLLQAKLGQGVAVGNFGQSGATMLTDPNGNLPYEEQSAYTKATNFVSNAGAGAVVSVVIVLGANDSKPSNWNGHADAYIADYEEMIDHFAALSTHPVVYLGLPLATGDKPCCEINGSVIHDEQVPLIRALAEKKQLPIIDLNTPTTGHPEYFGDGVHPNDAGYAIMTNLVYAGLEREPSVSITRPTASATLTSPVSLAAEVSADTVGIESVEFFAGATSIGKATSEPFTLSWNAEPGTYAISAKVTDITLATSTSAPVTVTVSESTNGGSGGNGGSDSGGSAGAGGTGATGGTGASNESGGQGGTSASGVAGSSAGAGGTLVGSAGAGANGGSGVTPPSSSPSEIQGGFSCRAAPSSRSGAIAFFALAGVALRVLQKRKRARR